MTPFDVWRVGLTLGRALDRWGGGPAWAQRHGHVMDRFDRLRTDPRSPLHDRAATLSRLQEMGADWEQSVRHLSEIRDALRRRLRTGGLVSVGFRAEAGGSLRLAPIPPETWQGDAAIDWNNSAIEAPGVRYRDVRVLELSSPMIREESATAAVDGDATAAVLSQRRE